MNKLLLILFMLLSISLRSANYYISNSGNDSLDGLTEGTAWETLAKVRATTFVAGDQVLLKSGDVWNEWFNFLGNGSVESRITVSSYGGTVKPEVRGYGEISGWMTSSNWSLYSTGIYRLVQVTSFKRLWIDSIERKESKTILLLSTDFPWRYEGGYLYIKSDTNPATKFSSIVNGISQWSTANLVNKSNLNINGIKFTGGSNSFRLENGVNITITNCEFGYNTNGYGMWIVSSGAGVTDNLAINGNKLDANNSLFYNYYRENHATDDGIYLGQGTTNCTINGNYFSGWNHTAFALVACYDLTKPFHDIEASNNFITAPLLDYARGIGVDYWTNGYNVSVHHNTVYNTSVRSQINGNNLEFHDNIIDKVRGCPYPEKTNVGNGLAIEGYASDAINMEIYNNVITNCKNNGILITSYNNTYQKSFNTIRDNNIIENDDITDYQLRISSSATSINNNSYFKNHFYKSSKINIIYTPQGAKSVALFNGSTPSIGDVVYDNDGIITFDIPTYGIKTTPLSELRIEHNTTGAAKTINLDSPMLSTLGDRYELTASIDPYSSIILLKDVSPAYYISNSGNDSNDGLTEETPWRTLDKVNATTFIAGDKILFRRGDTFYGNLIIDNNGTLADRITLDAYGTGVEPIITGFTTVTAWTNLGSDIWESTNAVSTLSTCNMVLINGVNTAMGRYPNMAANGGYLPFQTHSGGISITSSSLTGTPNWTGAELFLRNSESLFNRLPITSQSGGTLTFDYSENVDNNISNGFGFFIQNDVRTLDSQNEWYYNPSTKKIRIFSSAQPVNVKVSSVDNLITVTADYITLNNLSVVGANKCGIINEGYGKKYTTIQNTAVSFSGIDGISLRNAHSEIENCTISDSNTNGITFLDLSDYSSVRNSTIQNSGVLLGMGSLTSAPKKNIGIYVDQASNSNNSFTAEYNRIINTGFNGISFYSDSTFIKNNYIDTFCTLLDDGSGVYTWGDLGRAKMVIDGNIIINGIGNLNGTNVTKHLTHGIYLDDNTINVEVKNNTALNCSNSGMILHNAKNCTISNNTFYNNTLDQFVTWDDAGGGAIEGNLISGNKFISKNANQPTATYFTNDQGVSGSILNIGTFDNNYYARPIDDNLSIVISETPSTLAQWKAYSSQDANSKKSPKAISTVNDMAFIYNETNIVSQLNLPFVGVDVTGKRYIGASVSLQPYTSLVLIKDIISAPWGQGNKQWKF